MSANAKIVTRAVSYQDGGTALEGYLAYDDVRSAGGKLPGVLIVHEWWGLNDYVKRRAEQFAQLGYVAFALDMYGKGVVTEDAKKAGQLAGQFYGKPLMATRAKAGLDSLLGTKLVDPAKVAGAGYCFGGSTSLALAYSGAPLAAVVTFHGGLLPAPDGAGERIQASFLICHGGDDPMVSRDDVIACLGSLGKAKVDYQFIEYSGALHAFSNPDVDRLAKANGLVGKIGYNAAADRRSWEHCRMFLSEVLGR